MVLHGTQYCAALNVDGVLSLISTEQKFLFFYQVCMQLTYREQRALQHYSKMFQLLL